jgi:hypothetical protein
MAKLTIRDLASADVDLWGKAFETVPATRSVERKIQELEAKLRELTDDQTDEMVALTAEMLDARLKPAGQGRKKASEIIIEKWNGDELTVSQLLDFVGVVSEADRPT